MIFIYPSDYPVDCSLEHVTLHEIYMLSLKCNKRAFRRGSDQFYHSDVNVYFGVRADNITIPSE